MSSLSQRCFPDSNLSDVRTLFIMESPGTKELMCDYACVGETGSIMSKHLRNGDSVPLGCRIKHGEEKRIALFETFVFPLSASPQYNGYTPFEKEITRLKKLDKLHSKDLRTDHYAAFQTFWNEPLFQDQKKGFLDKYKKELLSFVQNLSNCTEIAICGFIAQFIFMQAFNLKELPYRKLFSLESIFNPPIFFSNHPSVEIYGKKWDYPQFHNKTTLAFHQ